MLRLAYLKGHKDRPSCVQGAAQFRPNGIWYLLLFVVWLVRPYSIPLKLSFEINDDS